MKLKHEPALDGLRALACLVVLLLHTGVPGFAGGFVGVDVFFVLSGFLITTLLKREWETHGAIDYRRFMVRRAARLLPALGLLLAAYAVLAPLVFGQSLREALRDVVLGGLYLMDFAAAFQPEPLPLTHLWSLAVEMQFYLVWPLILPALLRQRHPAHWLLVAWAGLTVLRLVVSPWDLRVGYYTPLHATGLLLGAAVALEPLQPSRLKPAALILFALAITLDKPAWCISIAETTTAVLLPSLLAPGKLRAAFSWRPAVWVGRVSYGLYLWHVPIALALAGSAWRLPLTLALGLGLAAISYYRVEQRPAKGRSAPLEPALEG